MKFDYIEENAFNHIKSVFERRERMFGARHVTDEQIYDLVKAASGQASEETMERMVSELL